MKPKAKKSPGPRKSVTAPRRSPPAKPVPPGFPIVGIGASAGGLEAFTQLLKQLPLDTGFGFVLVQHLDPQHESALTQLLTRATTMPVHEAANNQRIRPNHVYIIPPNATLGISRGILKLQPRSAERLANRTIDFFFEALAKDQRERAVGVILSGSASDGTLGLEAIKAEGGLTFAQDESARYDSMPRSAVAAGCVDLVLSPENIAKELARIAKHPYIAGRAPRLSAPSNGKNGSIKTDDGVPLPSRGRITKGKISPLHAPTSPETEATGTPEENGYKRILLLLRNHSGVDFSLYKSTTIQRRIMRRTVLNRHDNLAAYAAFLPGNTKELDALYSDALIGVTSFFRNADAFDVLQHKVFPKLLQQQGNEPLRVWVLGCSTGQEAYSIAIAYTEAAEKVVRARKLQIFATDLNEGNLHKARNGLYAKSLSQDVSPARLKRFFVEEDSGYRVIKSLRESVVFARQNVISDPSFSRMDLISCRNLMIYLEPSLQKKVMPTFHYALKPEGFLFLGASESVGGFTDLFQPIDKKQKIFSKRAAPTQTFQLPVHKERNERRLPGHASILPSAGKKSGGMLDTFHGELNAEREADRVTVNQFAPPGVLINGELQILQFRGPTGAFLEPPTGKANFDLLKMAREGLMLPLRTAINHAKKENATVRHEGASMLQNGRTRLVNIEVVPLKNVKELCFLVLFEDAESLRRRTLPDPTPTLEDSPPSAIPSDESGRIVGLERDLAETRDYLQSIQEHQASANEELQASNEEGQSANEELQSLNEELETSKEELESTNEELTTVNDEMVSRNTELNRLNTDLTNLQTSTKLVIVLLSRNLTIRRYSVEAERQFHLRTSDLGRPIGDIRHNFLLPNLGGMVAKVIASGHEFEHEVQNRDQRWFSLRIRPYLTPEGKVDGAVLILVDIDDLKKTEHLITDAHEHAEAIIRTVPNPLVTLTADLRVISTNDAFNRAFKVSPKEMRDRSIFEVDHGAWNTPHLRHLLMEVIPKNRSFTEFEVTHNFKRIGRRSLLLNGRILNEAGGKAKVILLGIQDVTEVLAFQADMRRSEMRFRRLFEAAQDGILLIDPATHKITDANPFILRLLGYSRNQLLKKELWQIGLLKDEGANREIFRELKAKGYIRYDNLPLKSKGGQSHEVEFVSNLYNENGNEVIQCNVRDITERKRFEHALIASEERYRALFELGPVGVYSCDAAGVILEYNSTAVKLWGRKPIRGNPGDRFCGSFRLHKPDGTLMARHQFPMAQVLSGKIPLARDVEAIIERPDGSRITGIANIVPLKDDQGKITGAINCLYDITERKLAETALAKTRVQLAEYAGQLEVLVGERTAELTKSNSRLMRAVVSAEASKLQYEQLFRESQLMQKKLRQLTHQIITAQEEERKEISRELHDQVVQALVGINVELSALGVKAAAEAPHLKDKIVRTQQQVAASVDAVHSFARKLRPAVLDDLGLIPALHAYSKNLAAGRKLKIQLTAFGGVEALEAGNKTVLFRVAQEALTNVVRHAHATVVKIVIARIPGAIRMEISDNGKSFQVRKTLLTKTNKRLGLVGMKERIEMVGGSLALESDPGHGTTVRAEIPFTPEKTKK